jgi:hypothetical protein
MTTLPGQYLVQEYPTKHFLPKPNHWYRQHLLGLRWHSYLCRYTAISQVSVIISNIKNPPIVPFAFSGESPDQRCQGNFWNSEDPSKTVTWAFWFLELSFCKFHAQKKKKKKHERKCPFHYACAGSKCRPFWFFSPSTQPIDLLTVEPSSQPMGLVTRASNLEGSILRPFSNQQTTVFKISLCALTDLPQYENPRAYARGKSFYFFTFTFPYKESHSHEGRFVYLGSHPQAHALMWS